MVEPGRRRLGDRYELGELIATGGMGQVWRGTDTALGRPVAIKVLRSEYTGDPAFLHRFRAEAQHAASLSHPNIAAVFDYGEEIAQDGTGETLAYLVMELVDGEPLSALLHREGALGTETTLSVLRQAGFALGEAHRAGLVHRDVKPGNILVRPDGQVKITDFGIAWSARSVALTRTGQVIGTPQYISPEQAEGRLATPASDIYALGLIGYECLTGRPAFDGDNAVTIALKQVQQQPEPLPTELPPAVRGLVARSLLKNPAARIPDGGAFVAAVEDVLAGRPLPASRAAARSPRPAVPAARRPPSATGAGRAPAPPRRRRLAMALVPVLGLLAGAGIVIGVWQAISDGEPSSTAVAAEQPATGTDRSVTGAERSDGDTGTVVLDPDDYVGRPVTEVALELSALGLTVDRQAQETSDVAPGRVTGLDPAGQPLDRGDQVLLRYAVAPEGTPGSGDDTGTVLQEAAGRAASGGGSTGAPLGATAGVAGGRPAAGADGRAPAAGGGTPGTGTPGTGTPGTGTPGTGTPGTGTPGTGTPGTDGGSGTPTDPAPVDPTPTDPAPVDPTPTDPAPVDPTPTDPAPVDPTPTDPAPVDPTPTDPAPTDEPTTETSTPPSDEGGTPSGTGSPGTASTGGGPSPDQGTPTP